MTTSTAPVTTPPGTTRRVATVIIGAGQAGLSTAHYLKEAGQHCLVVDAHARVGDQWRQRYDSLVLNLPARYIGLPGRPFPGSGWGFPTAHQLADYLEAYAAGFDLMLGTTVRSVDRVDGGFEIDCGDEALLAETVVVATGGERVPHVPDVAERLDPDIRQLHSGEYHNPDQLLPGPVLVVGGGQSGCDLALEIAQAGHETHLSGRLHKEVPVPLASRRAHPTFRVLWFLWNHVLTTRTPIGRKTRARIRTGQFGAPLVRAKSKDLLAAGVHLHPARTTGVVDGQPMLDDDKVIEVTNVLWCTGFEQDFGFIHPSVVGDDGWPCDDGGVVPEQPGLYFMGLLFQRGFYSMLVGGAPRDARRIAAHIASHIAAREDAITLAL